MNFTAAVPALEAALAEAITDPIEDSEKAVVEAEAAVVDEEEGGQGRGRAIVEEGQGRPEIGVEDRADTEPVWSVFSWSVWSEKNGFFSTFHKHHLHKRQRFLDGVQNLFHVLVVAKNASF